MPSSESFAREIRRSALRMVHLAKSSHIGASLSMADLIAVLFCRIMKHKPDEPSWQGRDRLLVSKGHACAIYYAALAECGYFSKEYLLTYCQKGSNLLGHVSHHVPGVELSTGSLGHGLPVGCGMALADRKRKVYVILGDGELNEGSVWEATLFAAQHRLDNLHAIIDRNGQQGLGYTEDIMALSPLVEKWRAFSWDVHEASGHDHHDLESGLSKSQTPGRPHVLIATTVKGKGVDYMEDQLAWHYKSPNDEQLKLALDQLE